MPSKKSLFERVAHTVTKFTGSSTALALAVSSVVIWAVTGPFFGYSETWQLVINTGTTIVTFLMVFLIQNAQNRDGSAIQAKLDELIRAAGDARNDFIGIEHLTETDLDRLKAMLEREYGSEESHHQSIERLIQRR